MATQPNNFYTGENGDDGDEDCAKKLDEFIKSQTAHNKAERREFVALSNHVDEMRNRINELKRDKVDFNSMESYVNLFKLSSNGKKDARDSEDEDEEEEAPLPDAEWRQNYEKKYKKLKDRYKELNDLPSRVYELEDKRIKQKAALNNASTDTREKMLLESLRVDNIETDVERHTKDIREIKEGLKRKLDSNDPARLSDKSPKRMRLEHKVEKLTQHNEALTDLVIQMSKAIGAALGDENKKNPFLAKIKAVLASNKE